MSRDLAFPEPPAGGREEAARRVFEEFLARSRTAAGVDMLPLVDRMATLRDGSPRVECLFHTLAGIVSVRARRDGGPEHLERALRLFHAHDLTGDALFVECAITATLTLIRPHEARARFVGYVDRLNLEPAARARLLAMIGLGDAWAGNLVRGQAEMLEARQLAAMAGRPDVQAEVVSWLVKCEALRGDIAASVEHLDESRRLAEETGSAWVGGHIVESAATLAFVRVDVGTWVASLELMVDAGLGTDSGLLQEYRWELATHRAFEGEPETARKLLDGAGDPPLAWPGAPAMPAWRAWILAMDTPDGLESAKEFEATLELLTRPAERLPKARMSWLLGVYHARAGRRAEAVRLLEAACAWYASIGAGGMLALAANDLRAAASGSGLGPVSGPDGVRPLVEPALFPAAGEQALTGAEVRVAVAIADGLSTREAAQRLFVPEETIELHLGNIFRKLALRNHTDLTHHRDQLG